ncbi:hypothetical protein PR048_003313 [Dryococelus australis]|uniref:HAT C-terminal dimerisation domain-containing protein n=1 Tax=Dryococelus australis TaxID=614101 RepID=A0ABQ9IP66_9NEOP|nr:hypothetical protein PR048_003313 [Dryococelus australis]
MDKFNDMNIKLQGKDKEIVEMISKVDYLIKKLNLWENNVRRGDLRHFPTLISTKEMLACHSIPQEKYPALTDVALRVRALFASTYVCESSFSNIMFIKYKYRTRLTE